MFSPPCMRAEVSKIEEHKSINFYQCDFCSDGWQSETEVEIHRQQKHADELDQILKCVMVRPACCLCTKRYPDVPSLLKHLKSQHLFSSHTARRVERQIFVCDHCHQIFFNKNMVAIHLFMLHGKHTSPSKMECPKCSRVFRKEGLYSHLQSHQILQSVASCTICLTKCKDRNALNEHIKSHTRYLNCSMCGYEAKRLEYFEKHLDLHGKLEETIDYEAVDESLMNYFVPRTKFVNWKHWLFHVQHRLFNGFYLQRGVYICVLCREICTSPNQMTKHLEVHKKVPEEKKTFCYVCTCGEEFSNNVLLKHHIFKLKGDHKVRNS